MPGLIRKGGRKEKKNKKKKAISEIEKQGGRTSRADSRQSWWWFPAKKREDESRGRHKAVVTNWRIPVKWQKEGEAGECEVLSAYRGGYVRAPIINSGEAISPTKRRMRSPVVGDFVAELVSGANKLQERKSVHRYQLRHIGVD
ncbi:LOW QUALITY PROTEIN: hypothetical protein V2J09_021193 [Rumex salicifolius]